MCLVERRYSIVAHPWCRGGVAQYNVRQHIRMMYMHTSCVCWFRLGRGEGEGGGVPHPAEMRHKGVQHACIYCIVHTAYHNNMQTIGDLL